MTTLYLKDLSHGMLALFKAAGFRVCVSTHVSDYEYRRRTWPERIRSRPWKKWELCYRPLVYACEGILMLTPRTWDNLSTTWAQMETEFVGEITPAMEAGEREGSMDPQGQAQAKAPQIGRFDYVRYDEKSQGIQEDFKSVFKTLEGMANVRLTSSRAKALMLTALEEAYMWAGKAIRDDQELRGFELQEQRTNS